MKFIIDNYVTHNHTQPLYFHKHINEYEQHEAVLLNNHGQGTYDTFDKIKPDVYITSASILSHEAIQYLSETPILTAINVQAIKASEALVLEEIIRDKKINCAFFFGNHHKRVEPNTKRIRFNRIMDCADLNLTIGESKLKYEVEKLILCSGDVEIKNYGETFHISSTDPELKGAIDFTLPIHLIKTLYANYKEIIVADCNYSLTQCFFDALSLGKKVYYDVINKSEREVIQKTIQKLFGEEYELSYAEDNKTNDFSKIQEIVLEKHTSRNRTKQLLSQIPNALTVNNG